MILYFFDQLAGHNKIESQTSLKTCFNIHKETASKDMQQSETYLYQYSSRS